MGALSRLAPAILLAFAAPLDARPPSRWDPYVEEASRRFAIPQAWIRRVIDSESRGRTEMLGRPIRSRTGAIGLMQLMPGTWTEIRAKLGLGPDPDDPRDNILAGSFYLRAMYDRFGYPGLFAAYNAGPARYADYLERRRPLPGETLSYLEQVAGRGRQEAGLPEAPTAPIFAVRNEQGSTIQSGGAAAGLLFVPLGQPSN